MSSSSQPPFTYLTNKIREWKAGDLLRPQTQSWERFKKIAPVQLSHILSELQQSLQAEGIHATVSEICANKGHVSLTIEQFDIEIAFRPSAQSPHAFLISARRRANPEDQCQGLIAYRDIELDLGHVMQIVEDIALRILGPRRSNDVLNRE